MIPFTRRLLTAGALLSVFLSIPVRFDERAFHTFGAQGDDAATAVLESRDGGIVAAGYSDSFTGADPDVYVFKATVDGYLLWASTYGGAGTDYAFDIIEDGDGCLVAAGRSTSFNERGDYDGYMLKLDGNGRQLWERSFGGDGEEHLSAAAATASGYAFAGYTCSAGDPEGDVYLVLVDDVGSVLWTGVYGDMGPERALALAVLPDGGFALAGYTAAEGAGGYDFYLLRTDADGEVLWTRTYGTERDEVCWGMCALRDGGFALVGETTDPEADPEAAQDLFVVLADEQGAAQWTRIYDVDGNDEAQDVIELVTGNLLITGGVRMAAGPQIEVNEAGDACVFELDREGALRYKHVLGEGLGEFAMEAVEARDATVWVVGVTDPGEEGSDAFLVELVPLGPGMSCRRIRAGLD